MRTTVTLDDDVADAVRARMRETDVGFKRALNDLVRQGYRPRSATVFATPTFDLGVPAVDLDKALALAAAIEDGELIAKQSMGR